MPIKKGGRKSLYGKTKNITKPKRLPAKPRSIPKDHPRRIQKPKNLQPQEQRSPGKWSRVIKRVSGKKTTPGGPKNPRIGGEKYKVGT